jgi:hypothetical protein
MIVSPPQGFEGVPSCVAWSPDGALILACASQQPLRLWDVQAGAVVAELEVRRSRTALRAVLLYSRFSRAVPLAVVESCYAVLGPADVSPPLAGVRRASGRSTAPSGAPTA